MDDAFIPAAKPLIGEEERSAVDAVMRSGMIAQGPEVAAFEREFSDDLAAGRPVVAVNSGTSGLHLGLLAAGIGEGDEVIVPSFTFAATGNSVALTGARPVFVDIEPTYFSLDPVAIRRAITPRTKAIMPVHLYGHPFHVDEITRIAEEYDLMLFEDAAQAHGATWNGKPVGTFGTFGMFSLYPTKNMTSGEGGMVSCESEPIARTVRLLRNQGMEAQYANEVVGFNARMTDIHAAIGRVQLKKLNTWTEARQRNARLLTDGLRDVPGVTVPQIAEEATHVFHQYTIRLNGSVRDEVQRRLRDDHAIGTGVYYPTPNHRLASLEKFAQELDLPETERAAREVLSLPVHPSLEEGDIERVVRAVTSAVDTVSNA